MRRILMSLPFALLPFTTVTAHDHDHHSSAAHGSLDAHVHGAAALDVVLEGESLALMLTSPAINLLGFEHAPKSEQDTAKLAAAKQALADPDELFGLPQDRCAVSAQSVESPLFESPEQHQQHGHADHGSGAHNDIHAHYEFTCEQPDNLKQLDLTGLFQRFPATQTIKVQLIGPNGQKGLDVTAASPHLRF